MWTIRASWRETLAMVEGEESVLEREISPPRGSCQEAYPPRASQVSKTVPFKFDPRIRFPCLHPKGSALSIMFHEKSWIHRCLSEHSIAWCLRMHFGLLFDLLLLWDCLVFKIRNQRRWF